MDYLSLIMTEKRYFLSGYKLFSAKRKKIILHPPLALVGVGCQKN